MMRTVGQGAAATRAVLFASVLVALAGCDAAALKGKTAKELDAARLETARLQKENAELRTIITERDKRIDTLLDLGPKRLERIFHVERIELSRYTGGIDTDGKAGHDAIKVYLRPIDADGSVLKAAGDVRIQLFDLAEPEGQNLIASYDWPTGKISSRWSSSAFTYHYSFECPWKSAPPKHDEITVRVTFTDYLTGKTFTAQKACKIKLPPPATTKPAQ